MPAEAPPMDIAVSKQTVDLAGPDTLPDPRAVLDALAACTCPHLIGVRHHSPALAAAMPAMLTAFAPDVVLLELPADLGNWIEWLSHPETQAPVALAASVQGGSEETLAFYPYADFSPELAAVRWARRNGVPVRAIDRAIGAGAPELPEAAEAPDSADESCEAGDQPEDDAEDAACDEAGPDLSPVAALCASLGVEGVGAVWDALVEARAPGSSPEAVRRAALLAGWLLRLDSDGLAVRDAAREADMRHGLATALADGFTRPVAVVGAFHTPALLAPGPLDTLPRLERPAKPPAFKTVTGALLGYAFEMFDERSGYPAGIRDPKWRQRVFEALSKHGQDTAAAAVERLTDEVLVEIARHLRAKRLVAGLPDARAAARMARGLANLRNLPAPSRAELLESLESALGQGEPLGRGRMLARALDTVMVGRTRGRVAPGTPRAGLVPHVLALLTALRLPGPDEAGREPEPMRLDPLRSPLDRRRHVAMMRLSACHVPYAERRESMGETLTHVWTAGFTPQTEALLGVAGLRGATLAQATAGTLRAARAQASEAGESAPRALLDGLSAAAECGLRELSATWLSELAGEFLLTADLAALTEAIALADRITAGHVPGLPPAGEDAPDSPGAVRAFDAPGVRENASSVRAELLAAAVRHVEGLAGSTNREDAQALRAMLALETSAEADSHAGSGRLRWALGRLAVDGSPLMRGAAGAGMVLLGMTTPEAFGDALASALDLEDGTSGPFRAPFWQGALIVAGPLLEADPGLLGPLGTRIEAAADADFLSDLPDLREGFDALSPAARERLLESLSERFGRGAADAALAHDPLLLAAVAAADAAARVGTDAFFGPPLAAPVPASGKGSPSVAAPVVHTDHTLGAVDRWRLILGQMRGQGCSAAGMRIARSLEQLYGRGQGEGSRGDLGTGGGSESSFPTVRDWAEELGEVFGKSVREEVLGRAAERGNAEAALALDPDDARPSIELLEQVLSLKGGLAESQLARMRLLVDRVVRQLVEALAQRLRPALHGLGTPRPTRRKGGPLDLHRTLRANLRGARPGEDPPLVPETFIFRTRARRSLDWRVLLIVDVSGSMEASVIYSALVAAILSALPAFSVDFLAFSTTVLDLTDRVSDPLGLLMEVSVGGGTNIAKALRHARERIVVPARTLLLLVTDFEEGGSLPDLLSQIRSLSEAGVKALGLAALDDVGQPRYSRAIAEQVVAAGMPVAALTPLELAHWIGSQVR